MNLVNVLIFLAFLIYHVKALSVIDDGENIFNDELNGFIPGTHRITCHCNICHNSFHCATDGFCYISSKFDKTGDTKIYTQGCFDQSSFSDDDNDDEPFFCRKNKHFPKHYERACCRENLCNGNYTIPYHFDDNSYSTENMFLLTLICAVIFLTLIAFILFFSCRMDLA